MAKSFRVPSLIQQTFPSSSEVVHVSRAGIWGRTSPQNDTANHFLLGTEGHKQGTIELNVSFGKMETVRCGWGQGRGEGCAQAGIQKREVEARNVGSLGRAGSCRICPRRPPERP
jgi:hypothetical protein